MARPSGIISDLKQTTKLLEDLFRRWRSRYALGAGNFICDGNIGSDRDWNDARLKVLFITKECNDPKGEQSGNNYDLRELFRNSHLYSFNRKRFEHNLGRWAYGLQRCRSNCAPPFGEADIPANRLSGLCASAVLNLKKLAGGAAANTAEIKRHVHFDKDFIIEQISILSPSVVVCGGTHKLVNLLVPDLRLPAPYSFQRLGSMLWLSTPHPSGLGKGNEEMYAEVVKVYLRCLAFGL
jgi:hypothetical protein